MTDLSVLGEFGVIARFTESAGGDGMKVGIGDDAAVVTAPPGDLILAADLLIEGRHFLAAEIDPRDLGYKALAVNVSDIAAMGGVPGYALVSLALPIGTTVEYVDGLREGFQQAAEQYGVTLAGGDTTGGEVVVINVAITGSMEAGVEPLTRAGAGVGDLVCVTNSLGSSEGGLRLLLSERADEFGSNGATLIGAHVHPEARLAEGQAAARIASAMIDISDGLIADLGHICESSKVGAEIDGSKVPVAGELIAVSQGLGFDPLECALSGGEDYELLMTVEPSRLEQLQGAICETGSELSVVGRIVAEQGVRVTGPGANVTHKGWDHFSAGDAR